MRQRRSVRLEDYDYSQAGAYFVTLCAWERKCIFGTVVDGVMHLSPQGIIIQDCWNDLRPHFPNVDFGIFVVMPNHFHCIVVIKADAVGAIPRRGPSDNAVADTIADRRSSQRDFALRVQKASLEAANKC
jgi:hypothetical protein